MRLLITVLLSSFLTVACTKNKPGKDAAQFHTYGFKIYQPLDGSTVTAGFGEIKNVTDKEMTVKAISSTFFKSVELHNMVMENDMMKMEKMNEVKVAPKSSLLMKSGSYHMMFFEPTKELKLGKEVPVNMEINGEIKVIGFKIEARL